MGWLVGIRGVCTNPSIRSLTFDPVLEIGPDDGVIPATLQDGEQLLQTSSNYSQPSSKLCESFDAGNRGNSG